MVKALLLATLAVSLSGPASAQDKNTIQRLNDQFAAAFNRGDGSAVAGFYTDRATVLPPGAEAAQGRAAIEKFWTGASQQLGDMRLTTTEVRPLGTRAAEEIGTFSLKSKTDPSGEMSGKYLVVWRKGKSGWKLDADIWNTSK